MEAAFIHYLLLSMKSLRFGKYIEAEISDTFSYEFSHR